jgi:hypothetical protein
VPAMILRDWQRREDLKTAASTAASSSAISA